MQEKERKLARKKLDEEMKPFRQAGREKNPTNGLLRATRLALRIPVGEIAGKMGVRGGGVCQRENNEVEGTITMRSLERQAEAMGCKVVYGVVPEGGETLEKLAEERYWRRVLGNSGPCSVVSDHRPGNREGGDDGEREKAGNQGTREQGKGTSERGSKGASARGTSHPIEQRQLNGDPGSVRGGAGGGGEAEAEVAGEWGGQAEEGSGPGGGGEQRGAGQTAAEGCAEREDGERAAVGNARREEGAVAGEEAARTILG